MLSSVFAERWILACWDIIRTPAGPEASREDPTWLPVPVFQYETTQATTIKRLRVYQHHRSNLMLMNALWPRGRNFFVYIYGTFVTALFALRFWNTLYLSAMKRSGVRIFDFFPKRRSAVVFRWCSCLITRLYVYDALCYNTQSRVGWPIFTDIL